MVPNRAKRHIYTITEIIQGTFWYDLTCLIRTSMKRVLIAADIRFFNTIADHFNFFFEAGYIRTKSAHFS